MKRVWLFLLIAAALVFLRAPAEARASALIPEVNVSIGGTNDPAEVVPALQVLFLISIITLAPSILMLFTGFTRIVITLHFVRTAMGTQQMPPNQVLVGVALVLTLFLMAPALTSINESALQPFGSGEISAEEAIARGMAPLNEFMLAQAEERDIALFAELAGEVIVIDDDNNMQIPNRVLIPAFILGELTKGFIIGFVLYLPFIVIDMVVASVLMAMGMMMLPPAMISMPFKLLLFILSGGWGFVIRYVMMTFNI